MVILAHRANVDGPSPATENRVPAIRQALARGWGLEIDIRRAADGRFYISHDPQPSADGLSAEAVFAAIREHPAAVVALNVKEPGDERALVVCLDEAGVLAQAVLFDMELIEPVPGTMARTFHALRPGIAIAARASDRGEPLARALSLPMASTIWLDEFDGPWATAVHVGRAHAAGRRVFAVSPELHGGGLDVARRRWLDFLAWHVDGICTDYPAHLQTLVDSSPIGVVA
jgi:glycerophosphoryl diester phosphodiesterase